MSGVRYTIRTSQLYCFARRLVSAEFTAVCESQRAEAIQAPAKSRYLACE